MVDYEIMQRLILTFESPIKVLAADKALRAVLKNRCRPIPTPSQISQSVCSMSIELYEPQDQKLALSILKAASLKPTAIHRID